MENKNLIDLSEFHFDESKKNEFYKKLDFIIDDLSKDDIYLTNFVRNLKKDTEYYHNSLTQIYYYIKNYLVCKKCSKKVGECLKENKYSKVNINKDEDLKRYVISTSLCSIFMKLNDAFKNNLEFSTLSEDKVYSYFLIFKNKVSESPLLYSKCTKLLNIIYKSMNSYSKSSLNKGFIIVNDESNESITYLFMAAIKLAIYDLNLKVSYLDFNSEILSALNEKDNNFEMVSSLFSKASKSEVLFIDNFDLTPKYASNFNYNYLLKLLKERKNNGYLTFASLSTKDNLNDIFRRKFKDTSSFNEVSDSLLKIFNEVGYTVSLKSFI